MSDIAFLKTDKTRLLDELRKCCGFIEKGENSNCPFHPGSDTMKKHVYEENGNWFFKCHKCGFGGDFMDVIAAREGRDVKDVFAELADDSQSRVKQSIKKSPRQFADFASIETAYQNLKLENRFEYTNPETKAIEAVVYRFRKPDGVSKYMPQYTPNSLGGWIEQGPPSPKPLFNRTRILGTDTVVLVEGEIKVMALHDLGIVATSTIGGANSAKSANWTPLKGKKAVYLWPDNDAPGFQFMKDAKEQIKAVDDSIQFFTVRVKDLGLEPKQDVVDYLKRYPDISKTTKRKIILDILADADPDQSPTDELLGRVSAIGDGRIKTIPWSFGSLTRATKSLLTGTVTLIAGDPGCSKTLWLLQEAIAWYEAGVKFAIYELEEDRAYHMNRMMAIHFQDARLADDTFIRENTNIIKQFIEESRTIYDAFGRCIYDAPDAQLTYEDILKWIEARAKAGVEIIVIDPITAVEPKGKIHEADLKFIMEAKTIIRKMNTRLILVTHKRKSYENGADFSSMSGGAAYGRFPQSIIGIEQTPIEKSYGVRRSVNDMVESLRFNRIIRVIKARNSFGSGMGFAFTFDKEKYRFIEHGVIQKNDRGKDGLR